MASDVVGPFVIFTTGRGGGGGGATGVGGGAGGVGGGAGGSGFFADADADAAARLLMRGTSLRARHRTRRSVLARRGAWRHRP